MINQFINGFSESLARKACDFFLREVPFPTEVVTAAKGIVRIFEGEFQAFAIGEQSQITARLDAISVSLEALTTQVAAIESRDRDTRAKGSGSPFGVKRRDTAEEGEGDRRGRIQCFNWSGYGYMADSDSDHLVGLVEPCSVLPDCDVLPSSIRGGESPSSSTLALRCPYFRVKRQFRKSVSCTHMVVVCCQCVGNL